MTAAIAAERHRPAAYQPASCVHPAEEIHLAFAASKLSVHLRTLRTSNAGHVGNVEDARLKAADSTILTLIVVAGSRLPL